MGVAAMSISTSVVILMSLLSEKCIEWPQSSLKAWILFGQWRAALRSSLQWNGEWAKGR